MFNAQDSSGWYIWRLGSTCTINTLRWDLSKLNMFRPNGSVCWAVCSPSGPNACCSINADFPSICGDAQTERLQINIDVYL